MRVGSKPFSDLSKIVIDNRTVDRYRLNYGLDRDIDVEHVEKHLRLEHELTHRLISSDPESRWQTFYECYTILYRELPWLNRPESASDAVVGPDLISWGSLFGRNSVIFEVGSGKARLLKYLTSLGHRCVATEITPERGPRHLQQSRDLTWRTTDGIHLAAFEEAQAYDFVVSSQLIEHLHPEDVIKHFRNAKTILKKGGEYIFDTPHRGAGPHDLSRVFDLDHAMFMHLKEYNFVELTKLLHEAGFKRVRAILEKPGAKPRKSTLYLRYCMCWDRVLSVLRLDPTVERRIRSSWKVRTRLLLPSNIWLSATA